MKKHLILTAALTLLPAIPAVCIQPRAAQESLTFTEYVESLADPSETATEEETAAPIMPDTSYLVLDVSTGEVVEVPLREYLIGSLCAEMPLSFEEEALKAQVIAAHTYAQRMAQIARTQEDPALKGADFSNDPAVYQAFYTAEELRERLGSSYDTLYPKAAACVDAVWDRILTYDDTPILAAFHAISTGQTESAANVWGTDTPYLQSVESAGDTDAPGYVNTVEFSLEDAKNRFTEARPDLVLSQDADAWFDEPVTSPAGTVLELRVGSSIFTGQEIRSLFSLRSAAFTISRKGDVLVFETRGYGHQVGLSQYGANAMAQAGADCAEILSHYYPGTQLRNIGD